MEIRINKEIRNYTENLVMGLSFRQTIFSVLACLIAVFIYFSLSDKIGTEFTSWLCIIGAIPFAAIGFIKFQGMYLEEILKHVILSWRILHTDLIDQPFNLYFECSKEIMERDRKVSLKDA